MRQALFLLGVLVLTGCTSSPTPTAATTGTTFDAASYGSLFDRAKDVLRDANFTIARVDARAGVITTEPRPSVGLITPWLGHHRTTDEAWQGFVHQEQRIATVTFEPIGGQPADLRIWDGEFRIGVEIRVERVERASRRHDASGIFFSSVSPATKNDRNSGIAPRPVTRRSDEAFSDFLTARLVAPSKISHDKASQ